MSPRDLDSQIVVRRLLLMNDLLAALGELDSDPDRLLAKRIEMLAAERILTQLVELASDINGHLASTALGRAPGSYRDSFDLAAEAGVLSPDLASELGPSVGLRNVLIHAYVDVDQHRVATSVPLALDAYTRYVRAVRGWLTQH